MQVIEGFNLRPPLKNTPEDRARWNRLLARVKQHFVFWPHERVQPKTDHIAFNLPDGTVLKLSKDGTKFRRFQMTTSFRRRGDTNEITRPVQKYASYEFGVERVTTFSSRYSSGKRDPKSIYSVKAVAKHPEGVDPTTIVDWAEYGGEPSTMMWNELWVSAHNAWISARFLNEESIDLLEREYFAKRMEAESKAWPVLKTLRLCHQFGNGGTATIARLPVELLDLIEREAICLEGAPTSFDSMVQSYEAKYPKQVKKS